MPLPASRARVYMRYINLAIATYSGDAYKNILSCSLAVIHSLVQKSKTYSIKMVFIQLRPKIRYVQEI